MASVASPLVPETDAPLLVGRERAQETLRTALAGAVAGHGSLVLISGEAGIGKTSLAEWLAAMAAQQGALILTGSCHDLTETPPFGPWNELLAALPAGLQPSGAEVQGITDPAGEAAIVSKMRAFLGALSARQPVIVLLEDLHWADPASLDLLRGLARSLSGMAALLLVTYRPEDLTRNHPLYTSLPVLVRESRPHRLDLSPLSERDLRALVTMRYRLPERDAVRLAAWLQARADGNPFYAGELLRGLEEQGVLRSLFGGWILDDPAGAEIPPLLRQVIDSRVARLSAFAQEALAVAAIVGRDVPISVWARVVDADADTLLGVVAAAEANRLVSFHSDSATMRFNHALIRETLYGGIGPTQRIRWHRLAGETLAGLAAPDLDAVAYHFQRAGDPRAVEWLLRAAGRAEQTFAWRSAADRCTVALALLEQQGAAAGERGWLGYRIAALSRYRDPRGALQVLDRVAYQADEAGDRALAACALFLRGNLHCYAGEFGPGIAALDQGIEALAGLSAKEQERLRSAGAAGGFVPDQRQLRGTLVMRLAGTGRFADAARMGTALVDEEPPQPDAAGANALRGLAVAYAALGRTQEARTAFARARAAFHRLGDHFHVGMTATQELQSVALPYRTDRREELAYLVEEAERAWAQASDAPADLPEGFARLPLLLLAGEWQAARDVALTVYDGGGSYRANAARALAVLASEQGDSALAVRLLQEELPGGPETATGSANYSTVVAMQRLAVEMALAAGDLDEARRWLIAHDRWLDWSGSAPGLAESALGWAACFRAEGNLVEARGHAERACRLAGAPAQPLVLLAAHRMLGELDTGEGDHNAATAHLERALRLGDECAAPYEGALTQIALAELHLGMGEQDEARALLDDAQAVCQRLEARPALARIRAARARLLQRPAGEPDLPAGLTEREAEVLRLVAAGESNREIADALTLSVRTVEKHIAHIYTKLGVRGRAEAATFAVRHGLLPTASPSR